MNANRGRWLGLAVVMLGLPHAAGAISWSDGNITHEYQLFPANNIAWTDAAAWIKTNLGEDWYLATITSAAEQGFFTQFVVSGQVGEIWIGGYQDPPDSAPAANWHWVTGEPWVYTNWWTASEPNDNYGPGSESYLGANFEGCCWNDEGSLQFIIGFAAERTAVPEPSTLLLLVPGLIGLMASRRTLPELITGRRVKGSGRPYVTATQAVIRRSAPARASARSAPSCPRRRASSPRPATSTTACSPRD